MTTKTSRRAVLAGAAALPALTLPAIAAEGDPIYAAIDKHRRAYEDLSAAISEQADLDDRLDLTYEDRVPRVKLYPERELTTSHEKEGDTTIFRSTWGTPTGEYYWASSAAEIEREATIIPIEHREVWIADRRAELAREKRRIRHKEMETGEAAAERRVQLAHHADGKASKELISAKPTTLAGCCALFNYVASQYERPVNELMADSDDWVTLLRTLARALPHIV